MRQQDYEKTNDDGQENSDLYPLLKSYPSVLSVELCRSHPKKPVSFVLLIRDGPQDEEGDHKESVYGNVEHN